MHHIHAEHAILKALQAAPVKTYEIGPCRDLGELPLHPRLIESRSRRDEYGHREDDEDSDHEECDVPRPAPSDSRPLRERIVRDRAQPRGFSGAFEFHIPEPIAQVTRRAEEDLDALMEEPEDASNEEDAVNEGCEVETPPPGNPYIGEVVSQHRWTASQSPDFAQTIVRVARAHHQIPTGYSFDFDFMSNTTTASSDTVLNERVPGTVPSEPPSESVREEIRSVAEIVRRAVGTARIRE